MAMRNAGVCAGFIGVSVTRNTAKSFGFCFSARQIKKKTKRFWLIPRPKAGAYDPALRAETLEKLKQRNEYPKSVTLSYFSATQ